MRGFHFVMGGDEWRVTFTKHIAPNLGELDEDNLTILVNPAQTKTEVFWTILHEIDHYPLLSYEGGRLSYRTQERIVREQEENRREALPQVLKHLGLPPWP